MTSSGRLTSTEKIGCTMLMPWAPACSVVVAVAAAARDHHDGGDRGTDGGGDQRGPDGLLGHVAARDAGITPQALLRDAGTFADRGEALAGEILHAVAQVTDLVESVVGERLGGGLCAGCLAGGDGH